MIVLNRTRAQSVVIDDRIFIAVSDFREHDVCLEISCSDGVMIQAAPRLSGRPGSSASAQTIDFVEVAPGRKLIWLRIDDVLAISDLASVYVVDCQGDFVRLGFETATNVSVCRKEVWDALQRDV